jgi:hypothetical protein
MATTTLKALRATVLKLIKSTYLLHCAKLWKKLQTSLSWLHFSVDMWTSPAKTGFQAIVVHWADAESRKVETALLSLKEFKGTHGGEEQAKVFLEVIREAGLTDKLGFFTMDNHGSNDVMLREIGVAIEDNELPKCHVRCFGHNLNLIAQAFLFRSEKQQGEGQDNKDIALEAAIKKISSLSQSLNSGLKT